MGELALHGEVAMAEMLRDEDSTERHLLVTDLHVRRCRKSREEGLIAAIRPAMDALEGCAAATRLAEREHQYLRDDSSVAEGALGLEIGSLGLQARELQMRGEKGLLSAIFGRTPPSKLRRNDGSAPRGVVPTLLVTVRALGPEHALASFVAKLEAAALSCKEASDAEERALSALRAAQAAEELAQGVLRRQYEDNYYESRRRLGRDAEKLFPRIRAQSKAEPAPAEPPASPDEDAETDV